MQTRQESLLELTRVNSDLYTLTYNLYRAECREVSRITEELAQTPNLNDRKILLRARTEFKVLVYQDMKIMNRILKMEFGMDFTRLQ